jgi:hypothetical protein
MTSTVSAFEPVTINATPAATLYRGITYRSDRTYTDAAGDQWVYVGTCDGDALWTREGDTAAWNITAVADQFGPLVPGADGGEA